jgi:hypothetical protein
MATDTPKVQSEDVRRLLRQRPFVPFRFHLKDGRVYEVRQPDMNLVGDTYIAIGFPEPEKPDPEWDPIVFVHFINVERLELEQPAAPPAG